MTIKKRKEGGSKTFFPPRGTFTKSADLVLEESNSEGKKDMKKRRRRRENDEKKKVESIRLPTAPAQGAVKSGGRPQVFG